MDQSVIKISEKNREYYKDSLALMLPDIKARPDLDEVYIVSPADFRGVKLNPDSPGLGIPVIEQGIMMRELKDASKEHYGALQEAFASIQKDFYKTGKMSDASLLIRIDRGDQIRPVNAAIIFLSDDPHNWQTFAPHGLSQGSKEDIAVSSILDHDDFKKYVVLPHEVAHILKNLDDNTPNMTTNKSIKELLAAANARTPQMTRAQEVDADSYAEGIFNEATKRGMTYNPYTFDRHLNFRTLSGVDHTIIHPRFTGTHTTTPFMSGFPFDGDSPDTFDKSLRKLASGVAMSSDRALAEQVVKHNQGDREINSKWDQKIQGCFSGAADQSYAQRKMEADYFERVAKILGVKKSFDVSTKLGFSESFRSCMVGDFSSRYKLLQDQFGRVEPGSPEEKVLGMYTEAAIMELAEQDVINPQHVSPDKQPTSAPAPGRRP